MKKHDNFSTVLEAAGHLTLEAKEELIEILHKRAIEQRRSELAADVHSARTDSKRGRCKAASIDTTMEDILK